MIVATYSMMMKMMIIIILFFFKKKIRSGSYKIAKIGKKQFNTSNFQKPI